MELLLNMRSVRGLFIEREKNSNGKNQEKKRITDSVYFQTVFSPYPHVWSSQFHFWLFELFYQNDFNSEEFLLHNRKPKTYKKQF